MKLHQYAGNIVLSHNRAHNARLAEDHSPRHCGIKSLIREGADAGACTNPKTPLSDLRGNKMINLSILRYLESVSGYDTLSSSLGKHI